MRCPRRLNNFLICVSILLFTTCFIFGATHAENTAETSIQVKNKKTKINSHPNISTQQKEIKDGLRRIEKKMTEKRANANRSN